MTVDELLADCRRIEAENDAEIAALKNRMKAQRAEPEIPLDTARQCVDGAIRRIYSAKVVFRKINQDPASSSADREKAHVEYDCCWREFGWQWRNVERLLELLDKAETFVLYRDESTIIRLRRGSVGWSVEKNGSVLNKRGDWEHEPLPSSRTDEFFQATRFSALDEAIAAATPETEKQAARYERLKKRLDSEEGATNGQ
jgi:hypothetical protein